jgi:hypothetical protein
VSDAVYKFIGIMIMIEYVVLGVAVLFVGALLYGTWRRQEQFTNMKGNYPPWSLIQQQVRAIFDKYYTYDLSAFASIGENDVFGSGKAALNKAIQNQPAGDFAGIPIMLFIQDPSKLQSTNKELAVYVQQFQKFLPPGFVPDMVNAPITTQMGVLEASRKYVGSLITKYDNKKPGPFPIVGLISRFYMIEILTVTFKNAIIMGTIEFAFQKIKPVPKTS